MEIRIRASDQSDLPFLKEMIWEALLASPTFVQEVGIDSIRKHEDEYWSTWKKQPDPSFIALDENDNNLGAIVLYPNGEQPIESYRIGIAVKSAVRGKGVGKLLMERVLDFAKQSNLKYINLFVDPKNIPAISLYKQLGFKVTEEEPHELTMKYEL